MYKNTFKVQFYARGSKADKNGQVHVEMSINVNQKRLFINLPMQVDPDKFNSKRKPKEYEDYISLMRMRINEILVEMTIHQEPITAERIREYIRTGGYKSYTIQDMFDDYLSIIKKRVGKNMTQAVYRRYELLAEMYNGDKTKEINALSQQDVILLRDMLLERYDTNTASGYLTKFKTFVRFAINNGKLKTNPTAYVKIQKENKPIDYLTESEIEKLENAELDNKSLQAVLDLFMFEINSGISYADMMELEKDDIQEINGTYFVSKRRKKTGTEFTAVILPYGVDILRKYDYQLRRISNQKMNAYLKVIGNLTGINKKLHTHLARHTYLTTLLNKGVRMEVVSTCAGHSNVKITQQFYARLNKNTIVNEVATALNLN